MKKLIPILLGCIVILCAAQTNKQPPARPNLSPRKLRLTIDGSKREARPGDWVWVNLVATNTIIKVESGYEPVTFRSNANWYITFR